MKKKRTLLSAQAALALGLCFVGTQSASAACKLNSPGGKITRVVYIIFDNVHLRRDNPNVPSDLEQMPNLLNFVQGKGVISGNHHTPLISHTADDILTGLMGVYGDRHGSPISNSFEFSRQTIPLPSSKLPSFTGRPPRHRAILKRAKISPSS